MSRTHEALQSSLSELAAPIPDAGELTTADLPEGMRSRFDDASVIGLGSASHGTQEFSELRGRLIRLLVEEFGLRAVGFEAGFDPMCRADELVAAGEGDLRPVVEDLGYRPMRTEPVLELFEWLQSYNASRPPEDRVHVYGFDATIIELAANELAPYLEEVGADVDPSVFDDIDVMTAGYGSEEERQAMLESARRVHSTLTPKVEANESAWVEATSRREYEHVRHRVHLIDVQLEAHELDHEERMARRDETMAENAEWVHDISTGPVVLWGANGHLNRDRHVLEEWDVDVPSMGNWLADSYGEGYCSVAFETATGTVAAVDGAADEVVEYPIPDPPEASMPDLLGSVDEPLFCLSVDECRNDPAIREWLETEPRRHNIWGGTPEGDNPVRYCPSDPDEFDWIVFVRETSPLVHLD